MRQSDRAGEFRFRVGVRRPPSKIHRRKAALEAALSASSRSPVRVRDPYPSVRLLQSCPMPSAGFWSFASTKRPFVTSHTRPLWRALHNGRYAQCSVMNSPVGACARSPSCGARACATTLSIISSCSEVPKATNPCRGCAPRLHLKPCGELFRSQGLHWPLLRKNPSQAGEFCWAVCHRHHVAGDRVKRLSALGLALSKIKRYVQRVLGLDASKASVHAACSLTASVSCA